MPPRPARRAALGLSLAALAALLGAAPDARATDVAPVASYVLGTRSRTLRGCPLKRVIVDRAGWDVVMDGLVGAPPAPDFARHVALLVVADDAGGARARLDGLALDPDGALRCVLHREEPPRFDGAAPASLAIFVAVVPTFPGGVHLDHRTHLAGGGGTISRLAPPAPDDRDPARLPRLGPDLRLTWAMADGTAPPAGLEVLLRTEVTYPQRRDLPSRILTDPFPAGGLPFPRIRDEVRYLYAAHAPGWRSARPLVVARLPADGPDGSPRPLEFRFLLEPVQGPPAPGGR